MALRECQEESERKGEKGEKRVKQQNAGYK